MMQLLMENETGHTKGPYVEMLLDEPDFHRDGTRVVYDALQWTLMKGIGLYTSSFIYLYMCFKGLSKLHNFMVCTYR